MKLARRQRGVALITAILVVALATILAVDIAFSGYLDQRRTSTLLVLDQGFEIALGAEALAAEALQQDRKDSDTDDTNEIWATPIQYPIDGGQMEGFLEDQQGRFNLNSLVDPEQQIAQASLAQLRRLLQTLQMDTKWAGAIADWVDANNVPEVPDGAEDSVYSGQMPPYLAANMPITRVSELLALPGFGLDNYRKLEPYVTTLPAGTPLNVCTAKDMVLDSLTSESGPKQYSTDPQNFERTRQDGCYPSLQQAERNANNDPEFAKLKPRLGEKSDYFQASIWVTIGTTEFNMYSLLHRSSTGQTRAILRSFGTT